MTNAECRKNDEVGMSGDAAIVIRTSFFIRHSSFVIP